MPHQPTTGPGPLRVTVVEAPACHFCEQAKRELARLAERHALDVSVVGLTDPRGADLMRRHRAGMSPLVLLDGELFSVGRLPVRKLTRLLEQRAVEGQAGDPWATC